MLILMSNAASSVVLCRCLRNDMLNLAALRHRALTMSLQVPSVRTRHISQMTLS